MTKQEQRIEIAKVCGWLDVRPSGRLDGQYVGYDTKHAVLSKPEEIPDYPHDLNACHEMEKCLGPKEFGDYLHALGRLFNCKNSNDWTWHDFVTATAQKKRLRS